MHTPNPETSETSAPQSTAPARRHARYSDDFKRQVVAACLKPGVSTAAIAQAHNLNANMLRRWVKKSELSADQSTHRTTPTTSERKTAGFIPVQLSPSPAALSAGIRIELQHTRTPMQIHWPIAASSQCAQWLREVLA